MLCEFVTEDDEELMEVKHKNPSFNPPFDKDWNFLMGVCRRLQLKTVSTDKKTTYQRVVRLVKKKLKE